GTRMANAAEPEALEIARTVAVARLLLGGEMNIQAPPNLNPNDHQLLLRAGINDWGGISPVTRDYVNPEAAWPHVEKLAATCRDAFAFVKATDASFTQLSSWRMN